MYYSSSSESSDESDHGEDDNNEGGEGEAAPRKEKKKKDGQRAVVTNAKLENEVRIIVMELLYWRRGWPMITKPSWVQLSGTHKTINIKIFKPYIKNLIQPIFFIPVSGRLVDIIFAIKNVRNLILFARREILYLLIFIFFPYKQRGLQGTKDKSRSKFHPFFIKFLANFFRRSATTSFSLLTGGIHPLFRNYGLNCIHEM